EPHLNGPGGEVPILLHAAASGETRVLCGQGVAPQAATIERCTELGIDVMPGTGLLSAVVPGAFDAWLTLLRDYGTWTFGEVLAPAIFYAENGFPLVPAISQAIASVAPLFEEAWPSSAALYLTGGEAPRAGTLFRNPVLAETWRRLVREAGEGGREAQIERARRAWYQGFVAEAIDDFCRNTAVLDTSGERHFGLLTGQDLADWQASYEAPLSYDYHGLTVCKTGPWGQGP